MAKTETLTGREQNILEAHFRRAADLAGRTGDLAVAAGLRSAADAIGEGNHELAAQAFVAATRA